MLEKISDTKTNYKGSKETYESVRKQIEERFGPEEAENYNPYFNCMIVEPLQTAPEKNVTACDTDLLVQVGICSIGCVLLVNITHCSVGVYILVECTLDFGDSAIHIQIRKVGRLEGSVFPETRPEKLFCIKGIGRLVFGDLQCLLQGKRPVRCLSV